MCKNKRWKREAKRLKGKSNDFDYDCFFCQLFYSKIQECKNSCALTIRELEIKCKK